jgi:hypothetical protein
MENAVNDHPYVPAHLAIEAMRDNGYKNTAYAIAELMDNSIEAGATTVELLCAEKEVQLEERRRKRVEQLAVLDNGKGMTAEVLRMALQFGNGTHLKRADRSGIGRFGMGLPASSISQCKRVDVWTWQDGVENAIHTYLDIVEVKNGQRSTVPDPAPKEIPQMWRQAGSAFGDSGTLVVWSDLDRLMWRSATAIIENSEFLIGRMYRKFLDNGKVQIRFASFDIETPVSIATDKLARPNDPGYLMAETSCPPPFDHDPMFKPMGEDYEATFTVDFRGEKHDIKIRFSYAKESARNADLAGSSPYGKHAKRNVGVSIVRADRELELDQSLVIQYDPRERWWGVEIEFPPELDELFGVTNNKQFARNFSDVAALDLESLATGGRTINEVRCELKEDGDPRAPLIDVVHKIGTQLNVLRGLIKAQTRGTRGTQRHERPTPEATATIKTRERQQQGYHGKSDADEQLPPDERKGIIEETLKEEGVSESAADELAATTISDNLKYLFAKAPLETAAFFSVKPRGGAIIITLNTEHPAYDNLVEVLEEQTEEQDAPTLSARLSNASDGLKLLLTAWARYEDELPDGVRKQNAQDARTDWGRVARNFLAQDE